MGMTMHVNGFAPPDDDWKRHKAVWDACMAARVDVPLETVKFFGHAPPDPAGVEISVKDAVSDFKDVYRQGLDVEISKLPPNVKIVRFYCAW